MDDVVWLNGSILKLFRRRRESDTLAVLPEPRREPLTRPPDGDDADIGPLHQPIDHIRSDHAGSTGNEEGLV